MRAFSRAGGLEAGMKNRPELDCDVHDLLDEANVLMLLTMVNIDKATDLIRRLRDCAAQAKAAGAGYEESERRLNAAADTLEKKIAASNT
jgi:hypothetical protein